MLPWEKPKAKQFIAEHKAEWMHRYRWIPFKEFFYNKFQLPNLQAIVTLYTWEKCRPEFGVVITNQPAKKPNNKPNRKLPKK